MYNTLATKIKLCVYILSMIIIYCYNFKYIRVIDNIIKNLFKTNKFIYGIFYVKFRQYNFKETASLSNFWKTTPSPSPRKTETLKERQKSDSEMII